MSQADKQKQYKIIINGQEFVVDDNKLSYEQVVKLAFPDMDSNTVIFTVTYRRADEQKPAGTLAKGKKVKIKNGTIFDVTPTTKS